MKVAFLVALALAGQGQEDETPAVPPIETLLEQAWVSTCVLSAGELSSTVVRFECPYEHGAFNTLIPEGPVTWKGGWSVILPPEMGEKRLNAKKDVFLHGAEIRLPVHFSKASWVSVEMPYPNSGLPDAIQIRVVTIPNYHVSTELEEALFDELRRRGKIATSLRASFPLEVTEAAMYRVLIPEQPPSFLKVALSGRTMDDRQPLHAEVSWDPYAEGRLEKTVLLTPGYYRPSLFANAHLDPEARAPDRVWSFDGPGVIRTRRVEFPIRIFAGLAPRADGGQVGDDERCVVGKEPEDAGNCAYRWRKDKIIVERVEAPNLDSVVRRLQSAGAVQADPVKGGNRSLIDDVVTEAFSIGAEIAVERARAKAGMLFQSRVRQLCEQNVKLKYDVHAASTAPLSSEHEDGAKLKDAFPKSCAILLSASLEGWVAEQNGLLRALLQDAGALAVRGAIGQVNPDVPAEVLVSLHDAFVEIAAGGSADIEHRVFVALAELLLGVIDEKRMSLGRKLISSCPTLTGCTAFDAGPNVPDGLSDVIDRLKAGTLTSPQTTQLLRLMGEARARDLARAALALAEQCRELQCDERMIAALVKDQATAVISDFAELVSFDEAERATLRRLTQLGYEVLVKRDTDPAVRLRKTVTFVFDVLEASDLFVHGGERSGEQLERERELLSHAKGVFIAILERDTASLVSSLGNLIARTDLVTGTWCVGESCGRLVRKYLSLVTAVTSYAETFRDGNANTAEDRAALRAARKQAIEELIEASTQRAERVGDGIFSVGVGAGLFGGWDYVELRPNGPLYLGPRLAGAPSLPLQVAFDWTPLHQLRVLDTLGIHAAVYAFDLGQYTNVAVGNAAPRWDTALAIGGQVGIATLGADLPVVLGIDARWAPTLSSQVPAERFSNKGTTLRVGGFVGVYVPFFDFN